MFEKRNTRTEISSLGEFGLIKRLTKDIPINNPSTVKGIGDDAAVMDFKGRLVLSSQDLLVEGVHFDLTYFPLKHLGYKAAVVNISDIYAMNGVPTQLTAGIAVSNRFAVEALEEIYDGMKLACKKYNVDFVGGDTTASPHGLFLSVSILGETENPVYRSGAKENDLLCVSGDLGGAYMGLLLLEREKQAYKANPDMQPDLSGYDYLLERQLKPEARADIQKLLHDAGVKPTAMIDISDGLASEILHLCTESKTGCNLYEEKIPLDIKTGELAKEFNIAPAVAALSGGEDYELLFTVDQKDYEAVKAIAEISIIGHMTDIGNSANLVSKDGVVAPLTAQGWDALLNKEPQDNNNADNKNEE
jgi:thiamine-monophosphate kinase